MNRRRPASSWSRGSTGCVLGHRLPSLWTPTADGIIDVILGVGPNLTKLQLWDNGAYIGEYNVLNGPDSGTLVRFSALWKSLDAATKQIDLLKFAILAEENAA